MSDILFRYLLTARRRERSVFRRLFLADDPLLEAGVEQLVETAAARIEVKSEHERVSKRDVTVPASRRRTVRFYDVAQPTRPREGHFEQRSEEFPLRDTLRVYTCASCRGQGQVRCGRCTGRGKVRCFSCGGSGRDETAGRRRTCSSCGGSGQRSCSGCLGTGKVTCGKCRGEGRLASWEVEIYRWLIEERSEDELPPAAAQEPRVRRRFRRWLKANREQVVSFEAAPAADHLGFETREALEVATRAGECVRRLEGEAQKSRDRYLFHRTGRSIAPVGYTVVRSSAGERTGRPGGRVRFYWLVGRGEQALEVTTRGRPDGVKCLGWLGFGSGGVMAYESVALALDQALPLLEAMAETHSLWLAEGSVASWLLALIAARRVRRRKPPVPVIGVIVASGQPTAFLTCLAYLGSYLGRLEVLDRAYDIHSRRLLGKIRPNRQSESLGIELADGRRIRLVEVANPQNLSAEQLRMTAQALDAVIILEHPGQTAADLRVRISSAAEQPPTIGTLLIDDGMDLLGAGAALPLEAVRQAFVEDFAGDVDWQALFDRMWRPLEGLLESAPAQGTKEDAG